MITEKIRESFRKGKLFVKSLNKDNSVEWKPIQNVMKHFSLGKRILEVITEERKSVTVTEDHSLFSGDDFRPIRTSDVTVNDSIVVEKEGIPSNSVVVDVLEKKAREYMYDLSVPGNENFFLASGILAHNSYSISGVSLDIEKSSKYMSMKENYISEYDKVLEAAKRSIKIIKGLRQHRYGVGITSALGPLNRPGVQSRRNWISGGRPTWS